MVTTLEMSLEQMSAYWAN